MGFWLTALQIGFVLVVLCDLGYEDLRFKSVPTLRLIGYITFSIIVIIVGLVLMFMPQLFALLLAIILLAAFPILNSFAMADQAVFFITIAITPVPSLLALMLLLGVVMIKAQMRFKIKEYPALSYYAIAYIITLIGVFALGLPLTL